MNRFLKYKSRWITIPRLFLCLSIGISACSPKTENYTIAPIENVEFLIERYAMTQANNADTSINQLILSDKGGRFLKVSDAEKAYLWFKKNREAIFLGSPYQTAKYITDEGAYVVVRNTSKEASLSAFGIVEKQNNKVKVLLNNPDQFSAYRAQFLEQSLFIFDGEIAIASPSSWTLSKNKDTLSFKIDVH